MRKLSGAISKEMTMGLVYLVINLIILVANFFGYDQFVPSSELQAILGGLTAVVLLVLRRYFTEEPIV